MTVFDPPYDLSNPGPSTEESIWNEMLAEIANCRYYFDGEVFKERVEDENLDGEHPLKYPVGINIVQMLALSQADAMFGDWDDLPFKFTVAANAETTPDIDQAIDLLHTILAENSAGKLWWEVELDRNVYGGAALKIGADLSPDSLGHIALTKIPRQSFFPIWDPIRVDDLLYAKVETEMSPKQAKLKFGYTTTADKVTHSEEWDAQGYRELLDGKVTISRGANVNPYKVVPFEYIPRFRFNSWWGESIVPSVMRAQNELNAVVADMGDAISYNSHPIRYGLNLSRDFNTRNFPVGANSMWYLGRTLSGSFEPKVGVLESQHAVSPEVFSYVKFIYDWTRTSAFAPPIAFGEDNGGGQRSGVTLEIRMWPLIKYIRRSRAYLTHAISRAVRKIGIILEQKQFKTHPVSPGAIQAIKSGLLVPVYREVLPIDHSKIVDEVVKLLATQPPSISVETAQEILGRGQREVDRIKAMLQDEEMWSNPMEERQMEMEQQQIQAKAKPEGK